MAIIFGFSLVLIIYCFIGYPAILSVFGKLLDRPVKKAPIVPSVSIIISAWNEEDVIGHKITNLLGINYPADKIEILIGSDGSDDSTAAIVRSYPDPRIIIIEHSERRGKIPMLNELVSSAKHEIIVFTDARQEITKNAISHLASNFADLSVGCVSGELVFHKSHGTTAKGINLYWEYEKFMRNNEAKIHSMLGATGALYAIRKELFTPVPHKIVLDDMYIPLKIIQKGFRAVFESEAKAFDHVADNPKEEYRRKARTLYGNFQIFGEFPGLFNPLKSPIALQLFSHKFLRIVVPFLMVLLLILNIFLLNFLFFKWVMVLQVLFYAMALVGANARKPSTGIMKYLSKICYIPYVFCLLNFSVFSGFWRFIHSKQEITWQKARDK